MCILQCRVVQKRRNKRRERERKKHFISEDDERKTENERKREQAIKSDEIHLSILHFICCCSREQNVCNFIFFSFKREKKQQPVPFVILFKCGFGILCCSFYSFRCVLLCLTAESNCILLGIKRKREMFSMLKIFNFNECFTNLQTVQRGRERERKTKKHLRSIN